MRPSSSAGPRSRRLLTGADASLDDERRGRRRRVDKVLLHPAEKLLVRELEVVTGRSLEGDLAGLVRRLEAEKVLLVELGLFHGERPPLVALALLEGAPPLPLVRVDHAVLERLHHHELLRLRKVGLERSVGGGGVLVVPAGDLGVLQVAPGGDLVGRAVVVGLEEDMLGEGVVGEVAEDLGQRLAEETDGLFLLEAGREGRDALNGPVDGDKRVHGRVVVLLDVAADEAVALREADGVEASTELGVGLDLGGEHVDGGVHVLQVSVDRVGDDVAAGWDAYGVRAGLLGDGLRDAREAGLEAGVAHAMPGDGGQGGGRAGDGLHGRGNHRHGCAQRTRLDLSHDHLLGMLGQVREGLHVRHVLSHGAAARADQQRKREARHGFRGQGGRRQENRGRCARKRLGPVVA
mmetsp:Transcript_58126/g.180579  ORF Transcript_58126/g.180579 Transcript_58126/m.180579 type:complete len:407 (-) Transcript_58126:2-1222(-)